LDGRRFHSVPAGGRNPSFEPQDDLRTRPLSLRRLRVVQLSEEAVRMELRDLFEELDVGASVEVKEAIANRIDASNAAIRVLDEIDEIIANKLLAAALA
jgi:hypothetical protein